MIKLPPDTAFNKAIYTLLILSHLRSVTVYVSPTQRVTATRLFPMDRRNTRESIVLTYGSMNWAGRAFVKACKKAGVPFPVKKVQYKYWPKKRGNKK